MKKIVSKSVCEYQCSGCIKGPSLTCYEESSIGGVGCESHVPGTRIPSIGLIFLGMPKGFNRLGPATGTKIRIFEKFSDEREYDIWNVPVWKYRNEEGHVLVRGLRPRLNEPFIDIYLEDCLDKIKCVEITEKEINFMD